MDKLIKDIIKEKNLKLGKAQPLWKCPRDIRIQGYSIRLGNIAVGWDGEKSSRWICIKVDTKDYNHNIMQQIKG